METAELMDILSQAEDNRHQSRVNMTNVDIILVKKVHLSITVGESVFIGITRDHNITDCIAA